MRNKIIDILKNTSGISDWRVLSTRTESTELFFVHKDLETVRSTETTDTSEKYVWLCSSSNLR